jgi:hypothetical protein
MRPKKRIAIWGADDDRIGILAFLLRTNAWNVENRNPAKRPDKYLDACLVLCDGTQGAAEGWARAAQHSAPGHVVAILAPGIHPPAWADLSVSASMPNSKLLEHLSVISARKRGPRKGAKPAIKTGISEISTGLLHRQAAAVQK